MRLPVMRGSNPGCVAFALRISFLVPAFSLLLIASSGGIHAQGLAAKNQAAAANSAAGAAAAQIQASTQAAGQGLSAGAVAALQRQMSLQARNQAAIGAMQDAQNAARAAAVGGPNFLFDSKNKPLPAVLDGLAVRDANGVLVKHGGLDPLAPQNWTGANAPTETVNAATGAVTDTVKQTQAQAILSWNTFNIGKNTELDFDQGGNRGWAVLNRVVNSIAPSQILGRIKADGQVYVINNNGIIFGGSSQVNTKALIASSASITDAQFLTPGSIYSTTTSGSGANAVTIYAPSFKGAGGEIRVDAGAQITTSAPVSQTEGGGFALLMGTTVSNAGTITTPQGQTMLAAGDDFAIRKGYGSNGLVTADANKTPYQTTRVNEIGALLRTKGSSLSGGPGIVTNTGLITAATGDITLAGETVTQGGIVLSTTSVSTRGTVHLLSPASDPYSSVTLAPGSLTWIDLDASGATALDSARAAAIASSADADQARAAPGNLSPQFDNLSILSDRQDLSRVEIVTGGTATFQGNSLVLANGGQVSVSAGKRVQADANATIDVSGANAVLPASVNAVAVRIEGFNLRDAPVTRDTLALNSRDVIVDANQLTFVPAATGNYGTDRYYTRGGLLEVGGELALAHHGIGEYASLGGTITLNTADASNGAIVAQPGSVFNIAGGSVSYQPGSIAQTYLKGADGNVYNINTAPANLRYTDLSTGFVDQHSKWNITQTFGNAISQPASVARDGYTVGKDAGRLILSTPSSLFLGDIQASAINGALQSVSRTGTPQPSGAIAHADTVTGLTLPADPYALARNTVALPGSLTLGQYTGTFGFGNSAASVIFGADAAPALRVSTAYFDAGQIGGFGLGGINVSTGSSVAIAAPLALAPGAALAINSNAVDIGAGITAPGGSVAVAALDLNSPGKIVLESNAAIDTRGLWTNLLLDPANGAGQAFVNGGGVSLSGNVMLSAGSSIDASSGGILQFNGQLKGSGSGGAISLGQNASNATGSSTLALNGALRSQGVVQGGALTLGTFSSSIVIGDGVTAKAGDIVFPTSFFGKGFSSYNLTAQNNISIAPGSILNAVEPVLALRDASVATGRDPSAALAAVLPELYAQNPVKDTLTQRAGASLTLRSLATAASFTLGDGAIVNLDPGKSFRVETNINATATVGGGQITIGNGAQIHAPSGSIALINDTPPLNFDPRSNSPRPSTGESVWLGSGSLLDVAGRAVAAIDLAGNRYGIAPAGGSVTLGMFGGPPADFGIAPSTDEAIIIRPGAIVDASGSNVTVDVANGAGLNRTAAPFTVAGDGGSIALLSNTGIFNDGTLLARSGGARASGGSLLLTIDNRKSVSVIQPANRVLTIGQDRTPSGLPFALSGPRDLALLNNPVFGSGNARISEQQIEEGGFDSLSFWGRDAIVFDGNVALKAGRSIQFNQGPISETSASASVSITAPYVALNGYVAFSDPINVIPPRVGSSKQGGTGSLTVNAGLIDIKDVVSFGNGVTVNSLVQPADYAGFRDITLNSTGDIRLLPSVSENTSVMAQTNLTLTAAQIYATGPGGGSGNNTYSAGSVIDIGRAAGALPPQPLALGGLIAFTAPIINQGGVVRQPNGSVTFNGGPVREPNGTITFSGVTNLLPGSVTSIGTDGVTIPYGGSVDGVTYNDPSGSSVTTVATGNLNFNGSLAIASGATLDLQGGGALLGAAFITGRGGSVDTLLNPLLAFNTSAGTANAPKNSVYAIVPGPQATAPGAANTGDQITIADGGISGLPAGSYTLLPSTYALLPGAFRVEIGGRSSIPLAATLDLNGSYTVTGTRSVANTAIVASLPNVLTITPGATVRTYSQYREQTYDDFAVQKAKSLGQLQPALFGDAKTLTLNLVNTASGGLAFTNLGTVLTATAPGGAGAIVSVISNGGNDGNIEIVANAPSSTPGITASYSASALSALNADTLFIGGNYGTTSFSNTNSVVVQDGTVLSASSVFLEALNGISVKSGAIIDTLARGPTTHGLANGVFYTPSSATVAVSNGQIVFVPDPSIQPRAPITIEDGAQLFSQGTIGFSTIGGLTLGAGVLYGTQNIAIASEAINIGSFATPQTPPGTITLDSAKATNTLPQGLTLNSGILAGLLNGSTAAARLKSLGLDGQIAAPKLQSLALTASSSLNFYGTVNLSTLDPVTGKSSLAELDINSPGIYGYGRPDDIATLTTGKFVWNGAFVRTGATGNGTAILDPAQEPAAIAGGPGSGLGTLDVRADQIVFGYGPFTKPQNATPLNRTILGFSAVKLTGTTSISANNNGLLGVYQNRAYDTATNSFVKTGGNLSLTTPLLTGDNGAVFKVSTGGALTLSSTSGTAASPSDLAAVTTQGASLDLSGATVSLNSAIVLPSGSLSVTATGTPSSNSSSGIDNPAIGSLAIGPLARIDLSGRQTKLDIFTENSVGGTATFESTSGSIIQDAASTIDVSATNNNAGRIGFTATSGRVALDGTLNGASMVSGSGDFTGGQFSIAAQNFDGPIQNPADLNALNAKNIADFDALNAKLNAGGFFGSRSFDLRQGDLSIDNRMLGKVTVNAVTARTVNVSVDAGILSVNGTIDASGTTPGTIRLAAGGDLTLAPGSILDAHGTFVKRDFYGVPIDAQNQASIELTSAGGALILAPGATIDARTPDGIARGQIALSAPRTGPSGAENGIAVSAAGTLNIFGARSIALNGFRKYVAGGKTGADGIFKGALAQSDPTASIDFSRIDAANQAFIQAISANGAFSGKVAGLGAYGSAYHLRPGVEVDSAGDLTVSDLDLSNYRYGPGADRTNGTGIGEPGSLVFRAGHNLNIAGTINDGFNTTKVPGPNGTAPGTPYTWLLNAGTTAGDVVVGAAGATLPVGTRFNAGTVLSFPLRIVKNATVNVPVDYSLGTYNAAIGTPLSNCLFQGCGSGITLTSDYYADTANHGLTLYAAYFPSDTDTFTLPAGYASPFGIEVDDSLTIKNGSFTIRAADILANYKTSSYFGDPIVNSGVYYSNPAITKPDTVKPGGTYFGLTGVTAIDTNGNNVSIGLPDSGSLPYGAIAGSVVPTGTTLIHSPITLPKNYPGLTNAFNNQGVNSIGFAAGAVFPMDVTLTGNANSGSKKFFSSPNGSASTDFTGSERTPNAPGTVFPKGTILSGNVEGQEFVLGSPIRGFPDLIRTSLTTVQSPALADRSVVPVPKIILDSLHTITSNFTATGRIVDPTPAGTLVYNAGDYVRASPTNPLKLYPGAEIDAGATLPPENSGAWTFSNDIVWPAGVPLTFAQAPLEQAPAVLLADQALLPGTTIPMGTVLNAPIALQTGVKNYADPAATLQGPGAQSWSYRLVGGADGAAADSRTVVAASTLGNGGNVTLSNPHIADGVTFGGSIYLTPRSTASFVRTGTGSIDILAGGNYGQTSLYGVYTAGTQTVTPAGAFDPAVTGYAAGGGGDVLVTAQGNLTAYNEVRGPNSPDNDSSDVGGWLFRRAGPGFTTAWGINFAATQYNFGVNGSEGFTGFGTLGGGNLTIRAGGDAGNTSLTTDTAIDAAVAGSGYVDPATGKLTQTGGGSLVIDVRNRLNPQNGGVGFGGLPPINAGSIVGLRGNVAITAGSIGTIALSYGSSNGVNLPVVDPFTPSVPNQQTGLNINSAVFGGPGLYLGDSVAAITTRGDLVLGQAPNPGGVLENKATARTTSFSLWTDRSAITLTSLGGNLSAILGNFTNVSSPGAGYVPSNLSEIAVSGGLSPGRARLAPSALGQLQLIAKTSIFGGNIGISGADPALTTTPAHPLYYAQAGGSNGSPVSDYGDGSILSGIYAFFPLVAFGPNAPSANLHGSDPNQALIDAATGDIVSFTLADQAKPADIRAGRDILNLTASILNANAFDVSSIAAGRDIFYANATIAGPGLLEADAGRNFYQGGSGSLESTGIAFNVNQTNKEAGAGISVLAGLGASGPDYGAFGTRYLDPANLATSGQTLASQPGKVAKNYDAELATFLYEKSLANYNIRTTDGSGNAFAIRDATGKPIAPLAPADAYKLYANALNDPSSKLTPRLRAEFLRQVYFAELKAGGFEYNNPASPRYRSYLRARDAIAALFPATGTASKPIAYQGDIVSYASSIKTDFGGNIETLAPGGQIQIGVQGGSGGSFITQGGGNVDLFSLNSIILGQGRVFTTGGGSILGYSVQGDINAGQGAKSAQVPAPIRIVEDNYGTITLSPGVPTSGAGFATLNPIPEVPTGDIDLIAPLGAVDPGEAGIRVSGNLNVAALQVLNANNIQVQGKSSGLPVFEGPNTGALTTASNTAAAANAAPPAPKSGARASIIVVEIIGFGGDPSPGNELGTDCPGGTKKVAGKCPATAPKAPGRQAGLQTQDPRLPVEIIGDGLLSAAAKNKLTPDERRLLVE